MDVERTNLNHLSLAPLTPRLPHTDHSDLPGQHHVSYIEGRSAPTTPSILSRSFSRVSMRRPLANTGLPKSKSSVQLVPPKQSRSGATTPKSRRGVTREELSLSTFAPKDRSGSDWLLRAGTALSASSRESKGQAWLVSRASSTSLSRQGNATDDEELEQELADIRPYSSRRGSAAIIDLNADDEFSLATARRSTSFEVGSRPGSRVPSRYGSRVQSRRGSRSLLPTPASERENYFSVRDISQDHFMAEPDFIGADEEQVVEEDESDDDEVVVRTLTRANGLGVSGWFERMLGWSLFPVDEDGEATDSEFLDEKQSDSERSASSIRNDVSALHDVPMTIPPLKDGEADGWKDAVWLLSVASKVIF
ncbi:hypothetical protein BJ878DRAFT_94752 [Calycina marina]|uniref:Uncharacterized protein n=1 Tax=Calycina marina TaxID=1763456 RepID=A0A9P7Z222_9HELO|nr:hypothetical protein BJ878DRAFT_94752 [Calycina marina]